MRIFLYESLTAGGWQLWGEPPPESLLREGKAMVVALATDLARRPDTQVLLLRHAETPLPPFPDNVRVEPAATRVEHDERFAAAAAAADWTIPIAPEIGGELALRASEIRTSGGRVLAPTPDTIALASDKNALARHLARHRVPVPNGVTLMPNLAELDLSPFAELGVEACLRSLGETVLPDFPFPAVLKPAFGAGSVDVRLVPSRDALPSFDRVSRLEEFRGGQAASVAVLCGPAGRWPLCPCRQQLSNDGRFAYLGGSLPLPAPLARRAAALADRALATLDQPLGYLGVDLVLGDSPDGAQDVVVEINPRVTTSYVGLRVACRQNLASAMIGVAQGKPCELSWRDEAVAFDSDGAVRVDAAEPRQD
jgi:hypothetical protein